MGLRPFPSRYPGHLRLTWPPGTPERRRWRRWRRWRRDGGLLRPVRPAPDGWRSPACRLSGQAQPLASHLSSEAALGPHQRLAVLGHRSPLSSEPTRPHLYFGLWKGESLKRTPPEPQISLQSARASCAHRRRMRLGAVTHSVPGGRPVRRGPNPESQRRKPAHPGISDHPGAPPAGAGSRSGAIFLKNGFPLPVLQVDAQYRSDLRGQWLALPCEWWRPMTEELPGRRQSSRPLEGERLHVQRRKTAWQREMSTGAMARCLR